MKRLFIYLLRRYSQTESQRIEIYKELWYQVKETYDEQTVFGNIYNMNVEMLMSNPFVQHCVHTNNKAHIKMIKNNLTESVTDAVEQIKRHKVDKNEI